MAAETELSKQEVRGRRNIKNKSVKQNERHLFDDEQERLRKEAGKRKHSSPIHQKSFDYDESDYEDSPYADIIDPKMIR